MSYLKKRVIAGALGLTLAFSLAACDGDEDPTETTPADDSSTTAPVGS